VEEVVEDTLILFSIDPFMVCNDAGGGGGGAKDDGATFTPGGGGGGGGGCMFNWGPGELAIDVGLVVKKRILSIIAGN
jgi:hypothetical protein